jgi:hypothetical protein
MINKLLGFVPKEELYKAIILSSYDSYIKCYDNVRKLDMHPYIDTKQWDALSEQQQQVYRENAETQEKLTKDIFTLVKSYCNQYPDKEICDYVHFKSYNEYPYRLEQNIPNFIKLL